MAMYQAILPTVIHYEIKCGDVIECTTDDLVQEIINFIAVELEMTGLKFSAEQISSVIEDTIEFIIAAILKQARDKSVVKLDRSGSSSK